jgi:hypothetical protein
MILKKVLLINKQSNDANIPVVYGERLIGGTRVFYRILVEQIIIILYMAIVIAEGEINYIDRNKNR